MTKSLGINFTIRTYCKSYILFEKFNFEACNVSKILMRKSHILSANVKVTKNVGRPSCLIIANNFFHNLSKQLNELSKPYKSRY